MASPINFPEVNCTYAETQPEYMRLPTFKDATPLGIVTSCWKLTWRERIKLFFTGRVWVQQMSFHERLQPQCICIDSPLGTPNAPPNMDSGSLPPDPPRAS